MPIFLTLLSTILDDMRNAIGRFIARRDQYIPVVWLGAQAYFPIQTPPTTPPIPTDILTRAWTRIGRALQRLTQLYTRWHANTLPKPRPSQAGKPRPDKADPNRPKRLYFPSKRAWLAGGTDHWVRGHASQLRHLLSQPDATEFLTAVPRAGRILRPLCHMLGFDPPAPIVLPPRPPRPRKPRPPKPPREKPRHGKYTAAQIRRYSPGRIPNSILK